MIAPEDVGRAMAHAASSRRARARHTARVEVFMTQKVDLSISNKAVVIVKRRLLVVT